MIEGLEVMLDMADDESREEYENIIEGLKIMLD